MNKNYSKGASYEARFIDKLLKRGGAVKAGRFYASKGITDVWWVDKKGIHHEAQLKYSSMRKPYISPEELYVLKNHAIEMSKYMKIWLVKKRAHEPVIMEMLS
jgi:Holliday junction resolvase